MNKQVKIIANDIIHTAIHENQVNEFLNANTLEILSIQNEVHGGNSHGKYTRSEIITIITYIKAV